MNDKIKCPNCSHEFDVEEAISGRLRSQIKAEYEQKINAQAEVFKAEKEKLEQAQLEFERKKEKQNIIFKEKLDQKLAEETTRIAKQTQSTFELKLKALADENEERKVENRRLKQQEIDLLTKEKKLQEQAEELELTLQRKMLDKQQELEEKGRQKERESFMLKEKEYQKSLDDQRKLIEEMKRKSEQGSMQIQGEVQELALEELLKHAFPYDEIEEVPKGINGADSIQEVFNQFQDSCGKIVYESKRTKNFDAKWIDKLKQDAIRVKGDISVLVTQSMPKGMDRFDQVDGVWVCHFNEVKSLAKVLRNALINIQSVKTVQDNKGDKMELLYTYLTSNDFVQKIKRIGENYDNMLQQLNSEKKAAARIFAAREKQIWAVQENVNALFGDIKGIAGNTLSSGAMIELPDPEIHDF